MVFVLSLLIWGQMVCSEECWFKIRDKILLHCTLYFGKVKNCLKLIRISYVEVYVKAKQALSQEKRIDVPNKIASSNFVYALNSLIPYVVLHDSVSLVSYSFKINL